MLDAMQAAKLEKPSGLPVSIWVTETLSFTIQAGSAAAMRAAAGPCIRFDDRACHTGD